MGFLSLDKTDFLFLWGGGWVGKKFLTIFLAISANLEQLLFFQLCCTMLRSWIFEENPWHLNIFLSSFCFDFDQAEQPMTTAICLHSSVQLWYHHQLRRTVEIYWNVQCQPVFLCNKLWNNDFSTKTIARGKLHRFSIEKVKFIFTFVWKLAWDWNILFSIIPGLVSGDNIFPRPLNTSPKIIFTNNRRVEL